ncbi:zinc finger MYM-type protein 1-like [Zingiber officinale]|uniref:zinc finger MYM-type protein 1-like n=1 Tax=Zingiber officinale TaxID=94328 RepID=UPI001C4C58B4|nr:zinc finger MYM-type protein 1-like [Zingiber officinale]
MARSAFVSEGFNSWKRVNDREKCAFLIHVGSLSSSHNRCVKCVQDLMNPKGQNESESFLNRGNFIELLKFQAHLNDEIAKVVLHNAPQNAKYTSPQIQKEILHILANKVRTMIQDELGDAKFCIPVDEAQDESKKEKMTLIFIFVNNSGFLVERFFEILSVEDTTSANLKKSISDIFVQHNIQIHNMRGHGYNGATAKDVPSIWQFFSYLTSIVNFVTSSPKRLSDLQSAQQEEIAYMLAIDECESGTGANQIGTLHRPDATCWSSHYDSVRNLIDMYAATYFQVMELNCRFSEATMELLALCSALDSTDSFKKFHMGDICKLASKFYPADFTQQEIHALRAELEHYQLDIVCDREFQQISTLSALYREMIVIKKAESYVMF